MRSTRIAFAFILGCSGFATAGDPPPGEITGELEANVDPTADSAARAQSLSVVTVTDDVRLVGHIERIEADGTLVVVGRRVEPTYSELGANRPSFKVGALVAVKGVGAAHGTVRADTIDVLGERDPRQWSKMMPQLVEFKEKYWKKAERLQDPAVENYLNEIVARLLPPFVPKMERRFKVSIVRDPDLNAFALPDGDLVVHTGLIARMENEAQLASVLAHEMAHATQRHALRAMDKSTEHNVLSWGSMLAAVALGVTGKGDAANGVQLMSSAWLSGYSRAMEDEADQVGLRYLYLAGYDVSEAPRVWQTFQNLYGNPTAEATFFHGSHSSGRDREHALNHEVWTAYQPSGLIGGRLERAEYSRRIASLTRVNALLDLDRNNFIWAKWGLQRSLSIQPDDPETHIAMATFATRTGALDEARDSLEHAVSLQPDLPAAHRELGYIWRRLGKPVLARAALARYLELDPGAADADDVRRIMARL